MRTGKRENLAVDESHIEVIAEIARTRKPGE
jgi:hypothetical protein